MGERGINEFFARAAATKQCKRPAIPFLSSTV